MDLVKRNVIYASMCLLVAVCGMRPEMHRVQHGEPQIEVATTDQPTSTYDGNRTMATTSRHMRVPINWQKTSETAPYPDLSKVRHLWVKVSLKNNRTYLYDGQSVIYTMYSTGGMYKRNPKTGKMKSMTPTGTFYVQEERGDSFYNQQLGEGANYYVSWLNHGEYLFHSVPTKSDGSYNIKEANKLGKSTGSHGCIRLSVPDAKWMSSHLPVGTKVKIVD